MMRHNKDHLYKLRTGEDPVWSPVGLHTGPSFDEIHNHGMQCIENDQINNYETIVKECHVYQNFLISKVESYD